MAEALERLVDVVHGEHDAEVAESVHQRVAVIGDRSGVRKRESSSRPWPSGVRIIAISTR
jgi:hypothetical protein